ncbi:MAG: flagellar hook-length control protein FliK [Paraburkholderia tropica]|nr:flagellar hook-length control protein FliK [Paraburkholderia tropica]
MRRPPSRATPPARRAPTRATPPRRTPRARTPCSATRCCPRCTPRRARRRASIRRCCRSCVSNSICSRPANSAGPARRGPACVSTGASSRKTTTPTSVHNQRGPRRSADDDTPWRTRLTLALPSLGTVDAELTLTGSALAVRVQASPGGAQQLTAHSEVLRGRIAALGLALAGLSIREIGGGIAGGAGGAGGAGQAARAADAYAHHAAQAEQAEQAAAAAATHAYADASADAVSDAHPASSTDWELG